jgi:hypothetical protein
MPDLAALAREKSVDGAIGEGASPAKSALAGKV